MDTTESSEIDYDSVSEASFEARGGAGGSGRVGNTRRPSPAKHWAFTWNNPPEGGFDEFLGSNGSRIQCLAAQEEIGESGTPHIQGQISFYSKCRPLGLGPAEIHWEKTRSVKHSTAYCLDPEKRAPDGRVWTKGPVATPLETWTYDELRPWQKALVDELKERPAKTDRRIIWMWEPDGNVGKTVLAKHLVDQCGALVVGARASDMKYAVTSWVHKHGGGPPIILITVPRAQTMVSYKGIEEIKDGLFFSSKYESEMVRYNVPHVVVLANCEPEYDTLSSDRWDVRRVETESE